MSTTCTRVAEDTAHTNYAWFVTQICNFLQAELFTCAYEEHAPGNARPTQEQVNMG